MVREPPRPWPPARSGGGGRRPREGSWQHFDRRLPGRAADPSPGTPLPSPRADRRKDLVGAESAPGCKCHGVTTEAILSGRPCPRSRRAKSPEAARRGSEPMRERRIGAETLAGLARHRATAFPARWRGARRRSPGPGRGAGSGLRPSARPQGSVRRQGSRRRRRGRTGDPGPRRDRREVGAIPARSPPLSPTEALMRRPLLMKAISRPPRIQRGHSPPPATPALPARPSATGACRPRPSPIRPTCTRTFSRRERRPRSSR